MRPEEILDPETFPDDLQWVIAQYRLQPDDPIFLLIAWHWHRVKASEDTIKLAIVELKTVLDTRIAALTEAADNVAAVNLALANVQSALEAKPAQLGHQFEQQLREPVASAVAQLSTLEKTLLPLSKKFQAAQRRQMLAALVIGVALGVLSAVIVLLA